jgi:L-serine dehydratase
VRFVEKEHLLFRRKSLPFHPNGLRFAALDAQGQELLGAEYFSVGGGFVVMRAASACSAAPAPLAEGPVPYPYASATELLAQCRTHGLSVAQLQRANEEHLRSPAQVHDGLAALWQTMAACVQRGCAAQGHLPGPLRSGAARPSCSTSSAAPPRPRCATRCPCSTGSICTPWP